MILYEQYVASSEQIVFINSSCLFKNPISYQN